jgi:hypothetical protein
MEYPNGFHPEPMVFEISANGLKLASTSTSTGAAAAIISVPAPRAG